jgi:hypothetical protein
MATLLTATGLVLLILNALPATTAQACRYIHKLPINMLPMLFKRFNDSHGIDLNASPDLDSLITMLEETGSYATLVACDYGQVKAAAVCDSATGLDDECVAVAEYEKTECASASACLVQNSLTSSDQPAFSVDCSAISTEFPDCKLDCGEGLDTCRSSGTPEPPTAQPFEAPALQIDDDNLPADSTTSSGVCLAVRASVAVITATLAFNCMS